MSIGVCRVSRHSTPPPTATMFAVPLQRSDNRRRGYATTATAARRLRDGWADGPVPLVLVSPCASRGIGCGHVGLSSAGREFHVPVDTVLWCPSGRHFHSRRPVAQRDRSHPSRETHPGGRADHRAWAPGGSRHSHNDPTSPTRCPEEPFLLDRFPDGVRNKFETLSRARCSAARCPGRARSSAGAPSRRDRPPFVPLRSPSDGRKCDATIEA